MSQSLQRRINKEKRRIKKLKQSDIIFYLVEQTVIEYDIRDA